ncbi:MAG: PHP-associated domain-containing protein [Candidatus Limnocylindrales bacterium]
MKQVDGSPRGSRDDESAVSRDEVRLGKADIHIHSVASDGTAAAAQILNHAERHTDLDVIAIADHERVEAAFECQRLAIERGSRVHVVVAEEVTTRSGHVLGVFLQARLRRNQRLETTIAEIHEQGGLAIVPHPFSAFTLGLRKSAIMRVHLSTDPLVYWDALEGFNPSTAGRYGRAATARIAAELGLPLVGNSDAHTVDTIGDGYTLFPGRTAEDYRRAVLAGSTSGSCVIWGPAKEIVIYGQQVRKQARDVSRWGRRYLLRKEAPRDLGVPPEQLARQREGERRYLLEREERRRATAAADGSAAASATSADNSTTAGRSLARRLLAARTGARARSMAADAGRREVEEPPA